MKTWKLAKRRLPCGSDEKCWIAEGGAYLEIRGQWGRSLIRCQAHAGEPVGTIASDTVSKPVPPSAAKPLSWLAQQAALKVKRMTVRGDFETKARAAKDTA